jgi:hypothetical protein
MPLSRAERSHLERRLLQERTRVTTAYGPCRYTMVLWRGRAVDAICTPTHAHHASAQTRAPVPMSRRPPGVRRLPTCSEQRP